MVEAQQNKYQYDLIVQKEMFYNDESMWGVYSFKFANPDDEVTSDITIHETWRNFVISGEVFRLTVGETYTVEFEDSYTERYGNGYAFIEVKSEGLTKRSAQVEFLQTVLPPTIADDINFKFPNNDTLLTDIMEKNINLLDVKGITENNIDKYLNAIGEFDKYQKAIVFLAPIGVSIKAIKRLSDSAGGAERLLQIINKNIYALTEFEGFGFRRVDDYALKLGYKVNDSVRLLAGAEYVLEQMSSYGDIKIPIMDFDAQICKVLDVNELTDEIMSEIIGSKKFYYDDGIISLTKYRNEEIKIADRLVEIQENVEELEGFEEAFEEVLREQEEANGFRLTDEQTEAVNLLKNNGIAVINGVAGSGKTMTTKSIVEVFNKLGKTYHASALSGKASQVLVEKGITNSSTIHRMLKWAPVVGFTHNEESPLPNDLVIVDEASMNNNTIFLAVINAIKKGARLLMIGDSGQLPPIGHGALFDTLLKLPNIPRVELTKVHRQAAKSGVIVAANEIREHKQINEFGTEGLQVIGELQDMRVFNYLDKTAIYDDLMATVKRFNDNPNTNPKEIQVLTAMKKGALGVPKLNEGIQNILNPQPTRGVPKPSIKTGSKEFRVGDRVIQTGNFYDATQLISLEYFKQFKQGINSISTKDSDGNYTDFEITKTTGVFNGTIGYIVEIVHEAETGGVGGMLIEFETTAGLEYVFYHYTEQVQQIGMLDLAYAITVHRSQGSGFKTVLFTFDYSAYMLLSKEFVYTGITRTINHCLMFVENSALHHAIKNTKSSNRKTYVADFLQGRLK